MFKIFNNNSEIKNSNIYIYFVNYFIPKIKISKVTQKL